MKRVDGWIYGYLNESEWVNELASISTYMQKKGHTFIGKDDFVVWWTIFSFFLSSFFLPCFFFGPSTFVYIFIIYYNGRECCRNMKSSTHLQTLQGSIWSHTTTHCPNRRMSKAKDSRRPRKKERDKEQNKMQTYIHKRIDWFCDKK